MNGNRVWRWAAIVGLAGLVLGCAGCARWSALMRADQIEREAKAADARAMQRQSDAYFLIGMEYYNLARAAQKAGDKARETDYAAKSGLYSNLAKGLARDAEEARMGTAAAAGSPAGAPASAPSVTPPPPIAPTPVGGAYGAPAPVAASSYGAAPAPAAASMAAGAAASRMAPAPAGASTLPDLPAGARTGGAMRSRP